MENRAYALAAGLFTVLLSACVVLAAMWFTGDTRQKIRYVLESHYPVTGLNEQAVVRYRGVSIGKVTTIEFDRPDPRVILIGIAIDGSVKLTRGTYAELRYQGVTVRESCRRCATGARRCTRNGEAHQCAAQRAESGAAHRHSEEHRAREPAAGATGPSDGADCKELRG